MLIKFKNAEVELYKVRKGTVVLQNDFLASYVVLLGSTWGDGRAKYMNLKIENNTTESYPLDYVRSDYLTWVEPF